MAKAKKQEALSVSRLINEVLVAQLSIPFRQIVNDTTFSKYTGSKRPDILISEFEYDGTNDEQYIKNIVAYAEAKDDCKVDMFLVGDGHTHMYSDNSLKPTRQSGKSHA